MKICIAGKNNIAVSILEYIIYELKYPKEKIFVIPNKDDKGVDNWQRSLLKFSKENNIKVVNLEEIYDIKDLIFLSLEFDRIINPFKFKSKKLFNVHFSLLPKYKGVYTSVWPILNNEKYTGVTLHYIDHGIDTGSIIAQKKIKIGFFDTSRDLYFKYIKYGIEIVKENLPKILKSEHLPGKQQTFINSSYYSRSSIDFSNIKIDLNKTAVEVHNQIRAFNFREYQQPVVFGHKIISSRILNSRSFKKAGKIIFEDNISFVVSTVDYNVVLYKDKSSEFLKACSKGDIHTVKELIQIPKIVNIQDKDGKTPLIKAIEKNNAEILKLILKNGGDVNLPDFYGKTPIMYAADTGDLAIINVLLSFGADIQKMNFNRESFLDYCKKHCTDIYRKVKGLLE